MERELAFVLACRVYGYMVRARRSLACALRRPSSAEATRPTVGAVRARPVDVGTRSGQPFLVKSSQSTCFFLIYDSENSAAPRHGRSAQSLDSSDTAGAAASLLERVDPQLERVGPRVSCLEGLRLELEEGAHVRIKSAAACVDVTARPSDLRAPRNSDEPSEPELSSSKRRKHSWTPGA